MEKVIRTTEKYISLAISMVLGFILLVKKRAALNRL